jgi:hypothetical protein
MFGLTKISVGQLVKNKRFTRAEKKTRFQIFGGSKSKIQDHQIAASKKQN